MFDRSSRKTTDVLFSVNGCLDYIFFPKKWSLFSLLGKLKFVYYFYNDDPYH